MDTPVTDIPAQAGIQKIFSNMGYALWTPAFAGVTERWPYGRIKH